MNNTRMPNRLINEKSPYLLQHAYNPVDWYPWSEEAFVKAKTEDKPIFLSIGYSTCHWCHVMERESFEDEEVAAVLNRDFVAIKVDREERPDIDHIYMTVCQGMTGHGGWPLTIVMTPDKKPFFATTYLPKSSRGGMNGMLELLPRIGALWAEDRQALEASSEEVSAWLQETDRSERQAVTPEIFEKAYKTYYQTFDDKYGGFGREPKFPSPHNLMFLLRYYYYTGEKQALQMVEKTLEKLYQGGIYDHIGFGFARYSTDRIWLLPHFEKMLYDNALLVMAYLETYQISRRDLFARVATEVLEYILRDMTSAEGGFYSAEDADSEGEEGKFYIWNEKEVLSILGQAEGSRFCEIYDITDRGNFEGKNIPHLIKSKADEKIRAETEASRKKLFSYREARIHPYKDDKILCGWNGLMIAALAKAYAVLHEPRYLDAARKAMDFIMTRMCRPDGRLLARYRQGEAQYPAYAADYSFLVWASIELYEATFDSSYLKTAVELNDEMLKYCWDEEKGGLFFYGKDSEQLLARPKEAYDGAIPSANSVATLNFLRLGKLTGDHKLEELAHQQLEVFGETINAQPTAHGFFLTAAMFALKPTREIVITGHLKREKTAAMLKVVRENYLPDTVTVFKPAGDGEAISSLAPYIKDMVMIDNEAAAYICENYTCQQPVTEAEGLRSSLTRVL
ncbi:MAG TPA: thioredoxin domain-containing protein [Syntrophomonadaceae bacterium]|nr:thioredoxin domain-containing protein [Syntrophomonadaceae bacterium]HPR94486.1 thioredoxin domain-containing protein [Syntrophomonadaceae bacterium]